MDEVVGGEIDVVIQEWAGVWEGERWFVVEAAAMSGDWGRVIANGD